MIILRESPDMKSTSFKHLTIIMHSLVHIPQKFQLVLCVPCKHRNTFEAFKYFAMLFAKKEFKIVSHETREK